MMDNLDAIMSYFIHTLSDVSVLAPKEFRQKIDESPFSSLSEDDKITIQRELEARFDISQGVGATISSDYKPWLTKAKSGINLK